MKRSFVNWRKLLPILLILMGAGFITVALAADLVGIGRQTGLGGKQLMLALAGFAMLLSGSLLAIPPGQRYLALFTVDTPPASLLLIAAWFGLLTGWGEALVWFERKFFRGQIIGMGLDFPWMVPLANLVLFVVLGLILSLIDWRWPKLISLRTATLIFAFTGFWSLLLLFPRLHIYAVVLLAAGLAVQTARLTSKHPQGFHRLVRYTMGWAVMLSQLGQRHDPQEGGEAANRNLQPSRREFLIGAGATVAGMAMAVQGWQRFAEHLAVAVVSRASRDAPNVLLIVLDTVRAQSLSLYGYHRDTTPQLERLAKAGVCFDRAIATAPWTFPSHSTMFTGRWPYQLSADWRMPLDDTYPTLAEVLSTQGYVTAGFVANLFYCSYEYGLNRGFAHYDDFPISPSQLILSSSLGRTITTNDRLRNILHYHELLNRKTAAAINADFLRWLSRQEQRPFFAFLNYFDAHSPYLPPQPFDVKFGPTRERGDFTHGTIWAERMDRWKMSPEEIQVELDAYEGAITYVDHQLGLLFDELEKRGWLENTLVIITSDHGEEFGEHGVFTHGNSLYLPSLYVPLVIIFPSRAPAGKSIPLSVSLRDLPATVVDLIGRTDASQFPGSSLARYWERVNGEDSLGTKVILSEVDALGWPAQDWYPIAKGDMKSLVVDEYHYILNGDGREELYDFENDPWETRDLSGSEEGRRALERFRTSLEIILAHG